jgi:SAM-dependent methyltransferase
MTDEFRDHFAGAASQYAAYRPRYPAELFAWLASLCVGREMAWDAGTGSGQAAVALADHFARVLATDASQAQLAHAAPHPRIEYRVARAETSGLEPSSADLVTAATAVHWFDRPRFWDEVQRVLAPGGVVAVWTYGLLEVTREVDTVIRHLYAEIVGPYWPFERRLVEQGYRTMAFPFAEITAPAFAAEAHWTLARLRGYLGTWSAVLRYREAKGEDPVELVAAELERAWGDPALARRARWPLALRVGCRVPLSPRFVV